MSTGVDIQALNEKIYIESAFVDKLTAETAKVIVGQKHMIERLLLGLLARGHVLLEGLPGLAKTLAIKTLSKAVNGEFSRIQFTPDLLPADIVGTMIYNPNTNQFSVRKGPIFANFVLADEINRAPAKVQSALLEAMQERQVTIGDTTFKLEAPFLVLATQNPIEQEGTYPLPEAQLDRFMMKIFIDYPSFGAEKSILDLKQNSLNALSPILSTDDLLGLQELVSNIYVDDKLKDVIIRICHATRPGNKHFQSKYNGAILAGASPRAAIWLYKIARFKAFLDGSDFVSPDHLLSIVPDVLGHRLILTYEASVDNLNGRDLAVEIAKSVI